MRAASWLELPARYSTSIPANFLNASGSLVLAPGSGGPLTTTLPSALPAASSASQLDAAGAAPAAGVGLAGALGELHATASPAPASSALVRSCRRVERGPSPGPASRFDLFMPPSLSLARVAY